MRFTQQHKVTINPSSTSGQNIWWWIKTRQCCSFRSFPLTCPQLSNKQKSGRAVRFWTYWKKHNVINLKIHGQVDESDSLVMIWTSSEARAGLRCDTTMETTEVIKRWTKLIQEPIMPSCFCSYKYHYRKNELSLIRKVHVSKRIPWLWLKLIYSENELVWKQESDGAFLHHP